MYIHEKKGDLVDVYLLQKEIFAEEALDTIGKMMKKNPFSFPTLNAILKNKTLSILELLM